MGVKIIGSAKENSELEILNVQVGEWMIKYTKSLELHFDQ